MAENLNLKIDFDKSSADKAAKSLKDIGKAAAAASKDTSGLSKTMGQLKGAIGQLTNAKQKLGSVLSSNQMIFGGLTLSIGGMMSKAFDLAKMVQGWRNDFAVLSNTMGDTSEAMGLWMGSLSQSLGGMEKLKSSMFSLSAAGVQVGKSMQQLAIFTTDMHMAAGISQDKLIGLTGNMHAYWNVSVKGAKNVVSSVIAMQKAFGTTAQQMEMMLGTVQEVHDTMAAFFTDGERSSVALTKGLSMVGGAMTKLGVNAQTANQFLTKMMDPDRFEETNTLMRMLNISYKEQIDMMSSATGKEQFFDKMLQNLPKISRQIQAIRDPFARMKFAKAIGLPPEIAAKMANARAGQLNSIISDYKKQADESKAAEEKRRKAAADRAKFEDTQLLFQMKVLAPMMQFVMKLWGEFMKIMPRLGDALQRVVAAIVGFMEQILRVFQPAIDLFAKGAPMDEILASINWNQLAATLFGIIKDVALAAGQFLAAAFIGLFQGAPWWGKILMITALITKLLPVGKSIFDVVKGIKKGINKLATKFMPQSALGGTTSAAGMLGKAGGIAKGALKMLGPAAALITAGVGAFQGAGKEATADRFNVANIKDVTGTQRAGGAAAGALDAITMGLLPKSVTDGFGEAFTGVLDGFKKGALDTTEKSELDMLNVKKKFGQKLSAEEEKRFEELNKKQNEAHFSLKSFFTGGGIVDAVQKFVMIPVIMLKNLLTRHFGVFIAGLQLKLSKLINSILLGIAEKSSVAAKLFGLDTTKLQQEATTLDNLGKVIQQASNAQTSGQISAAHKKSLAYGDYAAGRTISKFLGYAAADAAKAEQDRAAQLAEQRKQNKQLGGIGAGINSIDKKTKTPEKPKEAGDFLASILGQGSSMKLVIS